MAVARPGSARRLWLALALGALFVAGCGSYTKRDFAAQANAVCAGAVREIRALTPPQLSARSSPALRRSLADYLSHVVPIIRSESAQIDRLRRPAQRRRGRAELRLYLGALDRSVSAFERLDAAAATGTSRAVAAAESALARDPVAAFAAREGLDSCAAPAATIG